MARFPPATRSPAYTGTAAVKNADAAPATRRHPQLIQGASPRATLSIASVSRAVAFLRNRDYVVPEDVQCIWQEACAHRLLPAPGAEGTAGDIAAQVLRGVDSPKIR